VQIADDLAAVRRRIAEITSAGPGGGAEFGEIVSARLYDAQPAQVPVDVPAAARASRGEIAGIVAAAATSIRRWSTPSSRTNPGSTSAPSRVPARKV
jgi:hypothetical protein